MIEVLSDQDFKQFYRMVVVPRFDKLWESCCAKVADDAGPARVLAQATTYRLYDKALLLAVCYPMVSIVLYWLVTGDGGAVGGTTILETAGTNFLPERALLLFEVVIILLSAHYYIAANHRLSLALLAFAFLFALVVAFTFEFAAAVAGVFAVTGAIAFALTFARAVAGAFAAAFACAFTFAVIFAGAASGAAGFAEAETGLIAAALGAAVAVAAAVVYAVSWLERRARYGLAGVALTLLMFAAWGLLLIFMPWNEVRREYHVIFFFLGVFPLVNGIFDFMSYVVTLTLMRLGLWRWRPYVAAPLDLAVACLLFLALGIAMTGLVAAMNEIAGEKLIDLKGIFAGIDKDPSSYLWLYMILFSTILPTALHFAVSLLGWQSCVPVRLRQLAIRGLESADEIERLWAPPLVAAIVIVPLALVGGVFVLLWDHAVPLVTYFLKTYQSVLFCVSKQSTACLSGLLG